MKTSVLLFLVGIALGVAGMLVLGPRGDDQAPGKVLTGNSQADRKSSDQGPAPTRNGRERRKPAHRNRESGSGDVRTDLEEMLSILSTVNEESQLDMMALIRHASMLTRLNESEAIELLHQLATPLEDDDPHDHEELNQIASAIIFSRLCELNGPEAMRMATDGELVQDLDEDVMAWGMNSWVAADPEGAQRWYEGVMEEADAFFINGNDDAVPPKMLQVLDNDGTRLAYFSAMTKHDPGGLEESINKFESDDVRHAMREDLMTSLVARESRPEGLLEILNKSTDLGDVRISAVEKLSSLDPQQAAAWVEAQPPGRNRDQEINAVADKLMAQDTELGIDWYMNQEIQDATREKDRMSRIVYHLVRKDSATASEWVAQQPDNATRDHAETALAWTYANQKDWDSSMNWISGVDDQGSRDEVLNKVLKKGWDQKQGQLRPEVLAAAEASGLGETASAYRPK